MFERSCLRPENIAMIGGAKLQEDTPEWTLTYEIARKTMLTLLRVRKKYEIKAFKPGILQGGGPGAMLAAAKGALAAKREIGCDLNVVSGANIVLPWGSDGNGEADHIYLLFSHLVLRMPWFTKFGRLGCYELPGFTGTDDERGFLFDALTTGQTTERPCLAVDHPRFPGLFDGLKEHYRRRIEAGLGKPELLNIFRVLPPDPDAVVEAFFAWWQQRMALFVPEDERAAFLQLPPTHDTAILCLELNFHTWLMNQIEESAHWKRVAAHFLPAATDSDHLKRTTPLISIT